MFVLNYIFSSLWDTQLILAAFEVAKASHRMAHAYSPNANPVRQSLHMHIEFCCGSRHESAGIAHLSHSSGGPRLRGHWCTGGLDRIHYKLYTALSMWWWRVELLLFVSVVLSANAHA